MRRALIGAALSALVALALLSTPRALTPELRNRLTAALGERFDSDVHLDSLKISLLPSVRITGRGVVLRHKGRTDLPPLIRIESFSAEAGVAGLIGRPLHLRRVRLTGLEINVPPGGLKIDDDGNGGEEDAGKGTLDVPPTVRVAAPVQGDSPFLVDELISEDAVLHLLRSVPVKQPRVFEIHHLTMKDAGSNVPWAFTATLTNPAPPGEIQTRGMFGPWNAERPSQTALDARYEFRNADLGHFHGIRGTLHSTGTFSGVLDRIDVDGETSVPDFALEKVGHKVPLTTRFHAIVDGTSGNTWLRPVDANLLKTALRATGAVVETSGHDGRVVKLHVTIPNGRLEDVLQLAVKSPEPPIRGVLKLVTTLVLPPGEADQDHRLELDGSFEVLRARFTKGTVQQQINELSQKARGDHDAEVEHVVSNLNGRFTMRNGVVRFSRVGFSVPGARVELTGRYAAELQTLDFSGTVNLDAKVSELTTGVKSLLLKIIDPLLRHKGVTVIPITIRGTVDKPEFHADIKRALLP